ncbi:SUMF1/EgtB/PvdO family nonheme iron enzyme [Sulfitobacter sp. M57]|uniref:formylglycine-generating enzyme family protein n=1 Tax=unclassified Sulfitobacter TaxID=196795 RepID=UPI0023E1E51F|nr:MULTISPECIES: SUMF1/EgtB/PvdO family nonheme iron enzyme [unclassified Sulfitobacter]MDF3416618.1 SUMF1/EgtB/PvdO family nonheme iron enzyme [Sulfitobacter sp. KE5]MDF3424098.1 SUMF1/EgtB/PvdO family nonheme iron enzyme [Sulfitobacter sp. KE43]MDF3435163.1 SUMF1/EgtB/PvdO family nonheme iron enzyme [Sulfitobacter sp. KE42]MDF3460833.1 SUMF1/EgtB/PvdO family nonheme iron enzyme [Sulfitobacter sp. S74]MDF3464700.1 SUMF1/EgtB/PvdO family nonheme iron enzyme [Sulfitobacter sp. Ks18]
MTAAAHKSTLNKATLVLALVGISVAAITGTMLSQRGPDPASLPDMANSAVVMPDGRTFYAQRHEVTIAEWNRCASDGACELTLRARPDQKAATTPATGLSYIDVQQYVGWISKKARHEFRLPTAEEWNVMAAPVLPDAPDPLFTDPSLTWASSYLIEGQAPRALKPQGSFSTSPEGIVDLDGSVWEWTMECYNGLASGADLDRCPAFFVGGEHVAAMSYLIRDPARGGCAVGTPPAHLGMRLVSDVAMQQKNGLKMNASSSR